MVGNLHLAFLIHFLEYFCPRTGAIGGFEAAWPSQISSTGCRLDLQSFRVNFIPEPAQSLIAYQLDLRLRDVSKQIRSLEVEITGTKPATGLTRSKCCEGRLNQALLDFYERKANEVFETSKRILEATKAKPNQYFAEELFQMLLTTLGHVRDCVHSRKEPYPGLSTPLHVPSITAGQQKIHDWLRGECDLLAASLNTMNDDKISPNQNFYFQSAHNSRMNFDSTDHSINISGPSDIFAELSKLNQSEIRDEALRRRIEECISEMKSAGGNRTLFQKPYFRFMSTVADHVQVFSSILPALAQLIQ